MKKLFIASILFTLMTAFSFGQNTVADWNGDLSWNASPDAVAGYNLYKGVQGGPYAKVNTSLISTLTVNDAAGVADDCYVVTAVGGNGLESLNSNEACVIAVGAPGSLRFQ